MSTGTTVQMISMAVLCVVRDGSGLARALKRSTTIASSTSTNSAMAAISQSRKLWNQTMSSITGEADCCRPSSQGEGWPRPAQATPPAAIKVTPVTTKATNRLSTSIVLSSPSTRNSALIEAPFCRPPQAGFGSAPLSTAFCHGRGSGCGAAGRGEIPVSQTTIPALPQCTLSPCYMRQTACPQT